MKTIVIVLDCVRYDFLQCNGNELIYTPTIDELAGKGCAFHSHFTAAPWTSPSVASMLSGVYPHKLRMFKNRQSFPDNVKSIFKYYKQNNKPVASFVKSKNFFGEDREANEAGYSWELPKMLSWVERNNDQDYFLYLHYWSTHPPYFTKYSKQGWYDGMRKLIELVKTDKEENIQKAKNLYRAAIERASEEFVYSIIEKLDKLDSLKNCLIVITSDHGESWGERFEKREELDLFGMHGTSLYDEVIHVPLILFGKGIPAGRNVTALTRSVDLFPTLIELNGWEIDNSSQYLPIDGQTLIPVISGKEDEDRICLCSTAYLGRMKENVITEVIQKYACRDKNWKIIYDREKNEYELYDLNNDPGEKHNLTVDKPAVFEKYRNILMEYAGDILQKISEDEAKILADKLKNLGYM